MEQRGWLAIKLEAKEKTLNVSVYVKGAYDKKGCLL